MVKSIITNLKNTKGYISIETIVISGVLFGIGVVALMAFQSRANQTVQKSLDTIEDAELNGNVNNPWK